jgi:hypothetical protein
LFLRTFRVTVEAGSLDMRKIHNQGAPNLLGEIYYFVSGTRLVWRARCGTVIPQLDWSVYPSFLIWCGKSVVYLSLHGRRFSFFLLPVNRWCSRLALDWEQNGEQRTFVVMEQESIVRKKFVSIVSRQFIPRVHSSVTGLT